MRAVGRAAGGRAGRTFDIPFVDALLQWGLLNIGCSLGDGVCGVLGSLLDAKAVEQWVLSWRRMLLSTGWIGRAVGRAAVGRAGLVFDRPLVYAYALLQRRQLNIGRSLGDGVCGVLGALLDKEAVEKWVPPLGDGSS